MTTCRLWPHEASDGPGNMARDEALLDSVVADPSGAALRTYEWSIPTLSLGYFQSIELVESEPRWRNVPVVRRPTGGGAIWHEHELTYAAAVPEGHPLAGRPEALYRAVHGALVDALRERSVPAERRGPVDRPDPGKKSSRPFLCFRDRDPEDIVCAGLKIVGSAQRRRSGAVLQHGSLLLRRATATPEIPGLSELAGIPSDADSWSALVRSRIAGVLGTREFDHEPTPRERRWIAEREDRVYRTPAWTRRR